MFLSNSVLECDTDEKAQETWPKSLKGVASKLHGARLANLERRPHSHRWTKETHIESRHRLTESQIFGLSIV